MRHRPPLARPKAPRDTCRALTPPHTHTRTHPIFPATVYHLSFGMMLGIYTSVTSSTVSATETLGKLQLDDLMAVRKLVFPPLGSPETPPHHLPGTFKFKDYAPAVFHSLRERFHVDQKLYLTSLGGAYEYIEFNSNSKSGSFFFYSHDGKFMIKTQSKAESKFLRRILAHYYQHVMTNPMTYVTRFFGMHRIKMPHVGRTIHFVVMQSVFHGDYPMAEMFDLKVRVAVCVCGARARCAPPPPLCPLSAAHAPHAYTTPLPTHPPTPRPAGLPRGPRRL